MSQPPSIIAAVPTNVVWFSTMSFVLSLGARWIGWRIAITAALARAVLPQTIYWSGALLTGPL